MNELKFTNKDEYNIQWKYFHEIFDTKLKNIQSQLDRCESVCKQYEAMYEQLERKMKAIGDRHMNIQGVYDYMVKVGSEIAKHNPNGTAFLLPNDDPKRMK